MNLHELIGWIGQTVTAPGFHGTVVGLTPDPGEPLALLVMHPTGRLGVVAVEAVTEYHPETKAA